MSRQPSVAEIRLTNTIACLTPAVALLNELSDAFGTPFVPAISNTTLSLITLVQNVKKNKEDCIQLLENVYQLLSAIINLHLKSESKGNLHPATLNHVGNFAETLHNIHTFVEAQQEGSKIKYFFRQTETKTLLIECRAGLQQAFGVFKTGTSITALGNITQMKEEAEMMHKEVLELISTLSDGTTSDRLKFYLSSSTSISMLPPKPKIFHGRETELREIVDILHQESPRIAILGAGGMGKTTLAKAALHQPDIASKYEQCFFVVADSVTTSIGLSVLIREHIGLKPAKDATQQLIHYFATTGPSLLILDNLETSWEPMESRGGVEELLSKLTDITMRGAERPAKVHWTHPFLSPLKPLSDLAARDTFFAIAEDSFDSKDVDEVLSLTDNMPLVVDLIAHAVDYEGSCSTVLARWQTERTSLLSAGSDRRSNLDTSIKTSLSSPRMSPGAKNLLGLLSILPDGLSDVDLVQGKLPIQDIMTCKAILLATSLAYIDDKKRLKSLVPIREHMQQFDPPSPPLIHQLQKYFHQLLDLYLQYPRTQQGAGRVKHLGLNVRNMHELLLRGLNQDNPDLAETINCTFSMKLFLQRTTAGYYHLLPRLMDQIEAVLPGNCDEKFKIQLMTWKFESKSPILAGNADSLIAQAVCHFRTFNDLALEARFYHQVGIYYFLAARKLGRLRKSRKSRMRLLVIAQSRTEKSEFWGISASYSNEGLPEKVDGYCEWNTKLRGTLDGIEHEKNQEKSRKVRGSAQWPKAACGFCGFCATSLLSMASEYLHQALELAISHRDLTRQAAVLLNLSEMQWFLGDYGAAQLHARASHMIAEKLGDLQSQSLALRTLAQCHRVSGDTQNAIFLCQRAQKLLELCGTTTASIYTYLVQDLAEAHFLKSEYADARRIHIELARDTDTREPYNYAWALLNIAQLDIIVGASKQDVLHNLDKAKVLFSANTFGYHNIVIAKIYCDIELGKLHLREGEILTAMELFQACFHSTWGSDAQSALSCMESLANVSCWHERDFYRTARWTMIYLGYATKLQNKFALHQALQFLGDVFQAEGDSATSTALFTVALEGFTWMDIHRSRAECMLRLGDLAKGQGDLSRAIELWKLARPLYERSSQAKQVTKIDERLTTLTDDVLDKDAGRLAHLGQPSTTTGVVAEEPHKK
ncbi:hypothetical protein FB451DRAFT_1360049 [Mycena latifolia]|nr:hypothetical protein FB451DRAFT_1360049 [Mycena latifolia]